MNVCLCWKQEPDRVRRCLIISIIVFVPVILSGCWGITFEAKTPSEYTETKETIDAYYGSSRNDIISVLGRPDWGDTRNNSTYYIYEWQSSDKDLAFFVIPIPVAGGKTKAYIYCLMLEFDENDKLINHDIRETVDSSVHPWGIDRFETNCSDLYPLYASKFDWGLQKEINTYCPNADLGHADAQKRIGDIYYLGAYGIELNYKKAYVWYSLSAKGGNDRAAKQLRLVQSRLSPADLIDSQNQVKRWAPGRCKTDLQKAAEKLH